MAFLNVDYSALNFFKSCDNFTNHEPSGLELEYVETPRSVVAVLSSIDYCVTQTNNDRIPSHHSMEATLLETNDDDGRPFVERNEETEFPNDTMAETADNESPPDHGGDRPDHQRRRRLQGWRFGVASSAALATLVLVINFVLVVWASLSHSLHDGIGRLYVGDCDTVDTWSLWLHLLVNVLSSTLLGASNYTMQCLASPTRSECDTAHVRGEWLDIGVGGVHNLSWCAQSQENFLEA